MNIGELRQKQSLPLEAKIKMSSRRIEEWYDYYDGNVYISFSGGKDSTVLLDLVRSIYPDVEAVFIDTGLEYPELKEFIKSIDNVTTVRPKMSFKEVLEVYGYPIVSKSQSMAIRKLTTQNLSDKYRNKLLHGDERGSMGKLSDKWHYLLDAPFKIGEQCCDVMKKNPVKEYEKKSGKVGIIGTLAEESPVRKQVYLKTGCNAFESKRPLSTPLGFWTEQDILEYLVINNLEYASVYGNIIKDREGLYTTTGVSRTGCMFCMFGVHLENEPNRFQQMKVTHPKLYDYCINKIDIGKVLDYINVPY